MNRINLPQMEIVRAIKSLHLTLILFTSFAVAAFSQSLTSTSASLNEQTSYPVFTPNDPIYYFCGNEGHQTGSLVAASAGQTVTFTWEKYNSTSGAFDFLLSETSDKSTQNNLADGCYRVGFTENGSNYQFRAWVFNGWIVPTAEIIESICNVLKLQANAESANYTYYDLSTKQPITLSPSYKYFWMVGSASFATIQNPTITPPPSQNTKYSVEITDRAGCMKKAEVDYQSIVPKAKFSWNSTQAGDAQYIYPEAPAEIQFNDESENADRGRYEWYLFKDNAVIEAESSGGAAVDSIMDVLYDVNPIYTYENSGKYKVKLVVAKETQGLTCLDTFYLKDYIVVDTSLVKVAPAFTPNGDGINDEMIIKTRSLESLDFQVFNRWGKTVHHFKKSGYIPEDAEIAAWDGRVNGKLVPAGVYFYIVDAKGRDGERRRKKGFVQVVW